MSSRQIDIIYRILSKHRLDVTTEEILQQQIAEVFTNNGIEFEREFNLSQRDRIDFLAGDIGIEVKIKGSPNEIYQQCRRYCTHDRVKEMLLVTGRSMGLPQEIEGKPCYLLNLGKAWL